MRYRDVSIVLGGSLALWACSTGSELGAGQQSLTENEVECRMIGDGLILGGNTRTFTFDTLSGDVHLASTSSDELVASGAAARCTHEAAGNAARIQGSGTWNGTPGYTFGFAATHVSSAVATPTEGIVLDTVSLHVVSPSGETVYNDVGFSGTPHTAVDLPSQAPYPCTIAGSIRLRTGETIDVSVTDPASGPISGTLSLVGPPGGGSRTRLDVLPHLVYCRATADGFGDIWGFGTMNGRSNYYVRAQFQDYGPSSDEYVRIVAWDVTTGEIAFNFGQYVPGEPFPVTF